MKTQLLRAQVMLEPEDYERLLSLANEQKKSLSETIREVVLRYLDELERQEQEQFRKSLEELRRIREENAARYGVYQGDLINEVREERERQMEDVWKQWS
jgi:predicted SpoU family rRNA methylase